MAQGKPLIPQEKEAIVNLKKYFDRTKDDLLEQESPSAERVENALGFGIATIKRVMAEHKRGVVFFDQTPVYKGRSERILPDSIQVIIREYVRQADIEGRHITLATLHEHLKSLKPECYFTARTLGRALERWGFVFGKDARTQKLKEKDHAVAARQRYLRRKRANRKGEGTVRPEVYLDESYVNKNHSNDFGWWLKSVDPYFLLRYIVPSL